MQKKPATACSTCCSARRRHSRPGKAEDPRKFVTRLFAQNTCWTSNKKMVALADRNQGCVHEPPESNSARGLAAPAGIFVGHVGLKWPDRHRRRTTRHRAAREGSESRAVLCPAVCAIAAECR